MSKQFFPKIPAIRYEGPQSKDPLAFKHYDADALVEGKTMREHLRFAVVYWHTMRGTGADMFGWGTAQRPWQAGEGTVAQAIQRARAMFEFTTKLGAPFYCWHDRDVAPHGRTLAESNKNFDAVAQELKKLQADTGVRLLWGTAQNFVHPRYVHGAATSCNADVFCFAAAQVKKALEWTHELGGQGYVFWGGREGYSTLLNTDMRREMDHLARFMHMAVAHKKKIGFKGPFFIEPKPKEPTKHQYDSDAAACLNFLRLYLTTHTMLRILRHGGFKAGGVNFDAKVRRESFQLDDLFIAHIAGMDAFARGLKAAAALRKDGRIDAFVRERYRSWDSGIGARIEAGKASFDDCEKHALALGEVQGLESGRQELLESIVNEFI